MKSEVKRQIMFAKLKALNIKIAQEPLKTRHNVTLNPGHGLEIADAYDKLEHNPTNPNVKEAYNAFANETNEQFKALQKRGLKFDKLGPNDKGYASAAEMHEDIEKNNHLSYFPSEQGFGANSEKFQDHPMLKPSGFKDADGADMPENDIFRIVHDINGHNLGDRSDFSPEGEHAAFLTHRQQYSPLAQKALFTETAGQANWGVFNRKSGESNRKKILSGQEADLDFAEQKAGLFPDEFMKRDFHNE